MHSGYHVIDAIRWWLKQTNRDIKEARVSSTFQRCRFKEFFRDGEDHNIEKTAVIRIEFLGQESRLPCLATLLLTLAGPEGWTRESYLIITQNQQRITMERDLPARNGTPLEVKVQDDEEEECYLIDASAGVVHGEQRTTEDFVNGLLGGRPKQEVSALKEHLDAARLVQASYLSAIRGTVEKVPLS